MTEAQLYDALQEMFGIGDWSEDSAIPWYRARMVEIGKLKRLLKSRRVPPERLHKAALYAHARGVAITAAWQLLDLIPDALKAEKAQPQAFQEAVDEALEAGETAWAERFYSIAPGDTEAQRAALAAWRSR